MLPNLERLKTIVSTLTDASIPLVVGLALALAAANLAPEWYEGLLHVEFGELAGHAITAEFVVNDIFMALFFGLATVEVVRAVRPGGELYPLSRALNPVLASIGGIIGPAAVYLVIVHWMFRDVPDHDLLMGAWGVPTATDIALVWMVASVVFGRDHPAVDFILVLAVIDDLIGMVIIAIVYADASASIGLVDVAFVAGGTAVAWIFGRWHVANWRIYVGAAGALVWYGLLDTPLHPSLALVPVVPLLPHGGGGSEPETFKALELDLRPVVGLGLFFFGFVNGGVTLGETGFVTWVVLTALLVGKTVGISIISIGSARWLGLELPAGMTARDVVASSALASIGLTVALFVAGEAFPQDSPYQAAARMGALLSVGVAIVAIGWATVRRRLHKGVQ